MSHMKWGANSAGLRKGDLPVPCVLEPNKECCWTDDELLQLTNNAYHKGRGLCVHFLRPTQCHRHDARVYIHEEAGS